MFAVAFYIHYHKIFINHLPWQKYWSLKLQREITICELLVINIIHMFYGEVLLIEKSCKISHWVILHPFFAYYIQFWLTFLVFYNSIVSDKFIQYLNQT